MSNVVKPTIPAEVADAIEILREDEVPYGNENILLLRATGGKAECRERAAQALLSIPFDTLLAALVNGYERELTEEQRHSELKRAYLSGRRGDNWYFEGYSDGIKDAINTLGVKIEGVNA